MIIKLCYIYANNLILLKKYDLYRLNIMKYIPTYSHNYVTYNNGIDYL